MNTALQADDVTAIGIGIIVVVVVLGFLLSLVFAKIVAKIVVLLVVVGLGFLVWQQRTSVENKIKDKTCGGYTFFGLHVDPPDDVANSKTCKGQ
jgi:protein-S-isoprenylcysteine O-methyltransferase Ste14